MSGRHVVARAALEQRCTLLAREYYISIGDDEGLQCFDAVGWAAGRASGL